MTARRTGGKPKGLISEIDVDSGSSGPNSPSIDSDDASGRKKTNKTDKELRKIRGKHDENSLWLSDFDPTKGRKARTKLKETAYKDTHVGIVGAKNNKTVRKDSIYDAKGCLIQNGLDLCDCLVKDCPGCHFPCPRCKSSKCGHECRNHRKWQYDSVELDGIPDSIRENSFKVKC